MPSAYARTLSQIITDTQRLCGDSSGKIWRTSEIQRAVNDLLLETVRYSGVLKAIAVVAIHPDVNVYDLPVDCLRLLRVGMNGEWGPLLLPTSITEIDLVGAARIATGTPARFYREFLRPDQIGLLPMPSDSGSTSSRDSDYGLLRGVQDEEGNYLELDANAPIRRIRGLPFIRMGDGRIIREIIGTDGNMSVNYVRRPAALENDWDYPDPGFPEWLHKEFKYGAALSLIKYKRDVVSKLKTKRFSRKWIEALGNLQKWTEQTGPMGGRLTPL